VQAFPTIFVSKEAQKLVIVAAILNNTQQPGRVSVTFSRPRDFVQIASDKPVNYLFGLWLRFSRIILSQTCLKTPKMIAVTMASVISKSR